MGFTEGGNTKLTFPGPIGSKRRRMRSGGNVSTLTNNGVGSIGAPGGPPPSSITTTTTAPVPAVTVKSPLDDSSNISEEKTTQTSKCKGATTIPIFLKKTYKMVDTCDPAIASWTDDGDMFVVKDPDVFAVQVIPQYFDHNKFSSFARQLNFYGFRKMQSKPIRNSDFDAETAKHVTFFNENFKRGRCDLLKKIQRSTRGGGSTNPQDQSRELQLLRDQISNLEMKMVEMEASAEERIRRLEIDMLARMEQMMLAVQQQQHAQLQLEKAASVGTKSTTVSSHHSIQPSIQQSQPQIQQSQPTIQESLQQPQQQQLPQPQHQISLSHQASVGSAGGLLNNANNWDFSNYNFSRNNSVTSSTTNTVQNVAFQFQQPQPQQPTMQLMQQQQQQQQQQHQVPQQQVQQQQLTSFLNSMKLSNGPTLAPHPKQKMLPGGIMPGMMAPPIDRINSLRGISTLSRGFSGLSRGASVESTVLDENMFNLLMMEINESNNNNGNVDMSPTPIGLQQQLSHSGMLRTSQGMSSIPQLNNGGNTSSDPTNNNNMNNNNNGINNHQSIFKSEYSADREDLSDVSTEL